MAKVKFKLSDTSVIGNAEVLVRFYHSKQIDTQVRSHVFVPISDWKDGRLVFSTRYVDSRTLELKAKQKTLNDIEDAILHAYIDSPSDATSRSWLKDIVDYVTGYQDEHSRNTGMNLAEAAIEYRDNVELSDGRKRHYTSLNYTLLRWFDNYHIVYLKSITQEDVSSFETFLKSEPGKDRSLNYISTVLKRIRAICRRACENGLCEKDPFSYNGFTIRPEKYGTPVVLTTEEVNMLYESSMPNKHLERARDIFVFQCYTGQRISDLKRMKYSNISNINGRLHLSYIQKKTIDCSPQTVSVPLSDIAMSILQKYNGLQQDNMILPFISDQKYNNFIKEILIHAGITRSVTILDKSQKQEVTKPIYEVAASHLARRTFISSVYEITQEERITTSMTGHATNSSALDRYITVKDSTKQKAIDALTQKKPHAK